MKRKSPVQNMVLTALFAALTAVLSQIMIPIGPVPFNLGVFAVYLAGTLLTPGNAAASMAVYWMLGALGLPVFAGFQGGPAALFGKTGGYVLGYLFIALFTSLAVHFSRSTGIILLAMAAGLACCYGFGTLWFMHLTGLDLSKALTLCVAPFVLPDAAKAAG
ncbi:BioY protein, partial [gut metagenome]